MTTAELTSIFAVAATVSQEIEPEVTQPVAERGTRWAPLSYDMASNLLGAALFFLLAMVLPFEIASLISFFIRLTQRFKETLTGKVVSLHLLYLLLLPIALNNLTGILEGKYESPAPRMLPLLSRLDIMKEDINSTTVMWRNVTKVPPIWTDSLKQTYRELNLRFQVHFLERLTQFQQNADKVVQNFREHKPKISYDEIIEVIKNRAQQEGLDDLQQFLKHLEFVRSQAKRQGVSVQKVQRMIQEALESYDADKIGLPDYALDVHGGRVFLLPPLTSETYSENGKVIIKQLHQVEDCWCFKGTSGFVTIVLARRILPTEITIEHISRAMWPHADFAVRHLEFWGTTLRPDEKRQGVRLDLVEVDDEVLRSVISDIFQKDPTDTGPKLYLSDDQSPWNSLGSMIPAPLVKSRLLARVRYDIKGKAIQTFTVRRVHQNSPIDVLQVRIRSNYGNPDYTCVYRVRSHGVEVPSS